MIFWGDEDSSCSEAVKILEKGITGSTLVTVRGVGHNPHEEAPEIFNQNLLDFLKRI